jgi:hypothetical protein
MRKSLGGRTGGCLHVKYLAAALAVCLMPAKLLAQATHVLAPTDPTLLRVTREWGRESVLGDLVSQTMKANDVEVRFWSGFGLFGTSGTVLRRSEGRWIAWQADVQTCQFGLSIPIGDTLSPQSRAFYREKARQHCGDRSWDTLSAASIVTIDTVALRELPRADYEAFWQELKREGILELPPRVPRTWMLLDGLSYVVEVRRGDDYRASDIEHTKPEGRPDRIMQRIAALMARGPRR